ncbi:MAG TPA: PrsW family glutamic-type intramembrane protease [Anaerolineae bacterium]|nr:PrsW family glutamic-type intramembrane protease [Anaerolineae bacterium]
MTPLLISLIITWLLPLIFIYLIDTQLIQSQIPYRDRAIAFFWGVTVLAIQIAISHPLGLDPRSTPFITYTLLPIIEALLKGAIFIYFIKQDKLFTFRQGFILGTLVGIGFSLTENTFFTLTALDPSLIALIIRNITLISIHIITGGMIGFAIGLARFERETPNFLPIVTTGFALAIFWRAVFNHLGTVVQGPLLGLYAIIFDLGGIALIHAALRAAQMRQEKKRADQLIDVIIPLGVQLTTHKDADLILEKTLAEAQKFCRASEGIIYLHRNNELLPVILRNEYQNIYQGGTSPNPIAIPPLPFRPDDADAHPVTYTAHHHQIINIPRDHAPNRFPTIGSPTTPHPQTSLTLPLQNPDGQLVGVLHLSDARDPLNNEIIPFDHNLEQLISSFSLLAVAALDAYQREQSLKQEIVKLKIEIDEAKRDQQVAQITSSEDFNDLQARAKAMRARRQRKKQDPNKE